MRQGPPGRPTSPTRPRGVTGWRLERLGVFAWVEAREGWASRAGPARVVVV